MPITTLEETTSQKRLRMFAAIAAIIAVLQTVVAITMITTKQPMLVYAHEGLGYLYVAAAVLAAVPAVVWGRLGRKPGLIGHAVGLAVLGLAQLLLGFFMGGAAVMVHMVLGLLIALGAVALYVLANKKPIVVTNVDGTPRA